MAAYLTINLVHPVNSYGCMKCRSTPWVPREVDFRLVPTVHRQPQIPTLAVELPAGVPKVEPPIRMQTGEPQHGTRHPPLLTHTQLVGRHQRGMYRPEHPIHMPKEGKHPHGTPRPVHRILTVAVAVVADGAAPRQNPVEDGEIMADRGADLRRRGVKHQVVRLVDYVHRLYFFH
jgi:hypothetical protein